MIKALLRKQFAEVISQFSRRGGAKNGSSGKRSLAIFLAIFGILYLSLGFTFFTLSQQILESLTEESFPLFYMIVGVIATGIGLLGSVFNAYSTIYEAKDNEMLLSLPIPPHRIVFARIVALSAMTLLYAGSVLFPSSLAFLIYAKTSVLGKVNSLLLFLPLTLLVEAVTLGIAFVVAAIARKVKNKKAVVVGFSFLLTLLFYFVYFRAQNGISSLVTTGSIPTAARYALFFYYSMGRASQGSAVDMLIVFATAAAAFGIAYYLLSHFFVKFTASKKTASAKGKKGVVKSAGRTLSLFKREWRIFSSSPTYVMNSGFGVIFLIALPIVAIVKATSLHELAKSLAEVLPKANGCAIAMILLLFIEGMCSITAPSISIEGKRLYLLRSLPIDATEVFRAKIFLQLAVVLPFALFASITLAAVLGANAGTFLLMILLPFVHVLFTGLIGLCCNINFPVLDWTDEMTAVKSGASVLISVFGAMLLNLIIGGAYFLFAFFLPDWVYLLTATLLYGIADFIMIRWLLSTGKKKFERLG